jgi:hypothetical protein
VALDRMVFGLDETGALIGYDAAGNSSLCPTVISAEDGSTAPTLCSARAGSAAFGGPYAQAAASFGLRTAAQGAEAALPAGLRLRQPWASMACAVTCASSLDCWGAEGSVPALLPPADLRLPCALRLPADVADNTTRPRAVCVPGPVVPAAPSDTSVTPGCDISGRWGNGSLLLQQAASGDVDVTLAGAAGSRLESTGLALLPAFRSYRGVSLRFNDSRTVLLQVLESVTIDVNGTQFALSQVALLDVGTLAPDCTSISWASGSSRAPWEATSRCAARFIRIARTAGASVPTTAPARAPRPFSALDYAPATPTGNGSELLALAEVQLLNAAGVNLAAAPGVSATLSSAAPGCSGGSAAACAALAIDGSNTTSAVTASTWGAMAANVSADASGGWLLVDLGYDAPLDSVRLVRRANTSDGGADVAWGRLMAGVTVTGYRATADIRLPAAGAPADLGAAAPAFTLTVRDNAWEFDPTRKAWAWTNMQRSCGYDPVPSPSPSPRPSSTPAPSASATPAASREPPVTPTPSTSPSVSASNSPSASVTPSGSPSASATPSVTPSISASPSASPGPLPSEFNATALGLAQSDEELLAAAFAGTQNAALELDTLATGWRNNVSFVSLGGVPDIEWSANTSRVQLAWEPFSDTGSGIAAEAYCFGSAPFTCDLVGWTSAESGPTSSQGRFTVESVTVTGLELTPGITVFGSVAAVNNVGLVSVVTTNGFVVDDRPPAIDRVLDTGRYFLYPDALPGSGTVLYRPPVDIDCDVQGAGVGASWRDVAAGAGVGSYAWAVGSCPGCTDFMPWTDVGTAVAAYNASVEVPPGMLYYVRVRATGVTGVTAHGVSDGVRVLGDGEAAERMLCLNVPPPAEAYQDKE